MEPFDAPKPQHDEETEAAWPPGMPEDAGTNGANGTAVARARGDSWLSELPPEPEAEAEAERRAPSAEPEPEPVAEETVGRHRVLRARRRGARSRRGRGAGRRRALADDLPADEPDDEEPELHAEPTRRRSSAPPAVTAAAASDELRLAPPQPSRASPSCAARTSTSASATFEPRVIALIALLAVVAAVGLIVMRDRSTDNTAAPQAPVPTKNAAPQHSDGRQADHTRRLHARRRRPPAPTAWTSPPRSSARSTARS